jgi:hypothetical protein
MTLARESLHRIYSGARAPNGLVITHLKCAALAILNIPTLTIRVCNSPPGIFA